MPYKVLILGASYGSLLGTKLAMAGHDVTLVCREATAALINAEGVEVRLQLRGEGAHRSIRSADLPGRVDAVTPAGADAAAYDMVGLAMQEPQYAADDLRALLGRIARARVPSLSIMNMPPLVYLRRIPGLDTAGLEACYTAPGGLGRSSIPTSSRSAVPIPRRSGRRRRSRTSCRSGCRPTSRRRASPTRRRTASSRRWSATSLRSSSTARTCRSSCASSTRSSCRSPSGACCWPATTAASRRTACARSGTRCSAIPPAPRRPTPSSTAWRCGSAPTRPTRCPSRSTRPRPRSCSSPPRSHGRSTPAPPASSGSTCWCS